MCWSNSTPEKRSFCFLKPLSDRNVRSPSPCKPNNPFKYTINNNSKRDISAYLRIEKAAFESNLKAMREQQQIIFPVETNLVLEKRARRSCEDILENPIRIKRKSWFRPFNISNNNVTGNDIDNINNLIQGRESAPVDNNINSISQRMIVGGSIPLKKPGSRRPLSTCDLDLNGNNNNNNNNNNQIDESPQRNINNNQRKATKSIGISGNTNNNNNIIINNNINQNQINPNNPRNLSQLSNDISQQQPIILVTGSSKKQANPKMAIFGEENNTGFMQKDQLKHMQNQFNAHKFLHSASPVVSDFSGRSPQLQRVRHQSIKQQQFKEQYMEYQQQMQQQMIEKKQQQWQKRSRVISDDAVGVLKKNTNNFQLIPFQQSVVASVSKQKQLSVANYSQQLQSGYQNQLQQNTQYSGVSESARISNTEQAQQQIGQQLCSSPGKQLQSEYRAQQELKQSSKQPLKTQLLSKRFSNLESLVLEKSEQIPKEQQVEIIEQPQQQLQQQQQSQHNKQQFTVDLKQITDTNNVDYSSPSPKISKTNQFSSFLLQAREEQIKYPNGKQLDCYSPSQQSPLKQSRIRFQKSTCKSSENNTIRVAIVVEQSSNQKYEGYVKDNNTNQPNLPQINTPFKISSNCSQEDDEDTEELTEHDRSYLLPILDIQEQEYLQEHSCRLEKEEIDQSQQQPSKYSASLPELKSDNKLLSLHELLEENEKDDNIPNEDLDGSDRFCSSGNSGSNNCQQGVSSENPATSSDGLSTDIGLTVSGKMSQNHLQYKQQDLLPDGTGISNRQNTIFRRTHSVSTFKEQDNEDQNLINNKEKLKDNGSNLLSNNLRSSFIASPKTNIIKLVKNTEELKQSEQNDMEKKDSRKEQIRNDQGMTLSQLKESQQQGKKEQQKPMGSPIKQTSSSLSQQWQKLQQSQSSNSNGNNNKQQQLTQSTNGQSNQSISKTSNQIDSNYCVVNPALKAKLLQKGIPEVSSKCWAVLHSDTGEVLMGKNYTYTVEIASLTKIMTCWTTVKFLEENNIDLDMLFLEVSKAATKTIGTSAGLEKGDFLSVKELLYGLMLPSGNDAAITLSEGIGALLLQKQKQMKLQFSHQKEQQSQSEPQQLDIKDYIQQGTFIDKDMKQQQGGLNTCMNAFIKEMNRISYIEGLEKSRFSCVHGLPNKNNLSTAKDVGILSRIVMTHSLIRTIVNTQDYCSKFALDANKQATGQYEWENTNLMLDENGYDGVKTGITDTAGPCLSSSYKCLRNGQNVRLICVLLNCKSMDHRWTETKQLIAFTLKHLFPKKTVSANSP